MKISGSTVTIDDTTAGLYFRGGSTEITDSTMTITNADYGINTDTGDTVIRDSNVSIGNAVYGVFCNARTPGDKKVEITGGEFSVQNCSYGIVAQYEDVVMTGSKVVLDSAYLSTTLTRICTSLAPSTRRTIREISPITA